MEEGKEKDDIRDKSPEQVAPTSFSGSRLHSYNWLSDIEELVQTDVVQVQFKNTRNAFFTNPSRLDLHVGDWVAVEASPGHDIGQVSMTGPLVYVQMRKASAKEQKDIKKVFRKVRPGDMEKYYEAKAREHDTMIRSRKIAEELGLDMKIGDVDYQGDGSKAIFYYIADERVDFRKLIRVLADTFKIRIEMRQIGARQEAGRIGGIGPCGRPLCCATWMSHFVSVGTAAARFQDLSMNPQKLAGQCAKLKCCLNFEVDTYMEAQKKMPPKDTVLETAEAQYFLFKNDVLKRESTYSTDKRAPVNTVTIPAGRAFEVIRMNKEGKKPETLEDTSRGNGRQTQAFVDLVEQDSMTRFDKSKKKKKKKQRQQGDAGEKRKETDGERRQQNRQQRRQNQPPKKRDEGETQPV